MGREKNGKWGVCELVWRLTFPGLRVQTCTKTWVTQFCIEINKALGEGLDEGWLVGPGFDEGECRLWGGGVAGGFGFQRGGKGAAVEAGASAGVLRGKAEGENAGDAIGEHFVDHVGDEGMPVAHRDVDAQGIVCDGEGGFEQAGLLQCPTSEGWGFGAGLVFEANLRIAVLQLGNDMGWKGTPSGDFGEILGHFAEDVGSSVGEEEDGGAAVCGLAHGWSATILRSSILRGSQPASYGVVAGCDLATSTAKMKLGPRILEVKMTSLLSGLKRTFGSSL